MRPIPILITIILALAAVEGLAYWWMHPKPAGLGEPVLTYRPQVGRDPARSAHLSPAARDEEDQASEDRGQRPEDRRQNAERALANLEYPAAGVTGMAAAQQGNSEVRDQDEVNAAAQSSSPNQQSSIINPQSEIPSSSSPNLQSPISNLPSITPLPEIVAAALPSLRCTTGTAARIDRRYGVTIHVAFFEWDLASSTNVLEAFKHLPEQCMGSIGMTLIEKAPPRSYVVRKREGTHAPTSSSIQKSTINNHQSEIPPSSSDHCSLITDHSLSFDHTIFRDQTGSIIHAFKGTWVSGASTLLGDGMRGGIEQWNQLRWRAALKRFRPAHARVAQGAVRGIRNPDLAWQAFEESMLRDLRFE